MRDFFKSKISLPLCRTRKATLCHWWQISERFGNLTLFLPLGAGTVTVYRSRFGTRPPLGLRRYGRTSLTPWQPGSATGSSNRRRIVTWSAPPVSDGARAPSQRRRHSRTGEPETDPPGRRAGPCGSEPEFRFNPMMISRRVRVGFKSPARRPTG